MVNAGLKTNADCISSFNELKIRKKFRYIIYAIKDSNISIEKALDASADFKYGDFVNYLAACDGPRFAVLDYNYSEENVERSKIIFIFWCPDNVRIRDKMTYAAAKEDFQKKLTGLQKIKQVNDVSDIEESEIQALVAQ